MATDPSTLVLNQILSELQKLNDFERQAQREAQSLEQVMRADAQTPVASGLQRNQLGIYTPGGLSANASTPQILSRDEEQQMARQAADELANRQAGGQSGTGLRSDPNAEEAVAWSLLGEAGVGGPVGRLRQAQYSVGRNIGFAQGAVNRAQDIADVQAINRYGTLGGTVAQVAGSTLAPIASVLNTAQNHELATTLGVMAISTAGSNTKDWYEQGAAMGYGVPRSGALGGLGSRSPQITAEEEGAAYDFMVRRLQFGSGTGQGGLTGFGGIPKDYAKAIVGQLFEQGYTFDPNKNPLAATGNAATIAEHLAPAVLAMGQQGAQISGSWLQSLRSANDSVSDLTQMLEQMPAAAKSSQLGLEGVSQALQGVAATVSSMGGTQSEGLRMGQQFMQQYPGLHPQDVSGLLSSPIVQAFGLQQGVLPSGISALPGGQVNTLTQSAVHMVMGALRGLAPAQQYTTLADGTRVPLNNPQAAVAQQAASQFFPGVSPQDLLRILNQNPRRMATTSQLQDLLGQTILGRSTGLEHLTGGGQPEDWGSLSSAQQRSARDYWNQKIAPMLSQALSPSDIRALNQTGNISRRAEMLNQDLFGSGRQGANQPGNAATVQVQIGLTPKAAQALTVSTSAKDQARRVQNAGGAHLNVTLNSPLGQNPTYGGTSSSNGGLPLNTRP